MHARARAVVTARASRCPGRRQNQRRGTAFVGDLGYLVSKGHASRRFVVDMLGAVFKVPLSLGTVAACEAELSAALAQPYAQIQKAVQAAPTANLDETSWRCFQKRPWVWVAATAKAVLYGIRPTRSGREVRVLLADLDLPRTVGSDRFGAYNGIPLEYRQLCWAHLIRDFGPRMGELSEGKKLQPRPVWA